jgi:hypothetical protein
MPKVVSFADKNYQKKKALYDVIAQCVQDIKYGMVHSGHSWNLPVEHIEGITAGLRGNKFLEVTYHRYEVTTVEGLARIKNDGREFIGQVMKEIKKRFKKYTDKTLTIEEVSSDIGCPEKVGRLTAETSWMLGSSRYGHGARPVGRYLIKDTIVYEFSADL